MKKLLLALIILSIASFATNVDNVNYQGSDLSWHFDTDMQFTTGFALQLVSGGTTTPIQNGATVCAGSTLRVVPTLNAKWATPDFSAAGIYPTCGGGFCPAMIPYSTVTANRDIAWLSAATWDPQKSFGDLNDFSQDQNRYNQLGASSFYLEPVTYNNVTGQFYPNNEGGAGVFCKGAFEVADGSSVVSSTQLPTLNNVDFTISGSGSRQITTRLSGVSCFGVVVKHPLNIPDNPSWFWMDYFTYNQPSISSTVGSQSISVNIAPSSGTCAFGETSVNASSSLLSADQVLVKATMKNTGDPITIISVSGNNPGFSVAPFDTSTCSLLGFPPSLCPASNGFNEQINSGASKDLYVLITRGAGASGGMILTFTAQTAGSACGGGNTCTDSVDLNGPITCNIVPPGLNLGTQEVAQFDLSCQDLAGNPIGCIGDNWTWSGVSGGFIDKSATGAKAYTIASQGSKGQLRYRSNLASCLSDINVTKPAYECSLVPPSANLAYNAIKGFTLNGFVNASPAAPDSASYDLIENLAGTLSAESVAGATYTAPSSNSNGKLRAFAQFNSAPDPILGSVCFSSITVSNTTGNGTETNPDNPGATKYCTIGNGPLNVYKGFSGWIGIMCGKSANETCTGVSWSTTSGVSISSGDNMGVYFTITGNPGAQGNIIAYVNNSAKEFCSKPFFIGKPACWQFS